MPLAPAHPQGGGLAAVWHGDPAFLRSHDRREWGTTGELASPLSHALGKDGLLVARALR